MIQLHSDAELTAVYPLMAQLREHLKDPDDFIRRVRLGEKTLGYKLFGLEAEGRVISLCGAQQVELHCLSSRLPSPAPDGNGGVDDGRHLSVKDLVTDHDWRSRGYGGRLLLEVEAWAKMNGFCEVTLSSGTRRTKAHDFYTGKMGYSLVSHAFHKKI
jgi:Acetyltransferase (GNAT) family.